MGLYTHFRRYSLSADHPRRGGSIRGPAALAAIAVIAGGLSSIGTASASAIEVDPRCAPVTMSVSVNGDDVTATIGGGESPAYYTLRVDMGEEINPGNPPNYGGSVTFENLSNGTHAITGTAQFESQSFNNRCIVGRSVTIGAASPLRMVALGDSYSAGEGAGDYFEKSFGRINDCHRSPNAWPSVLARYSSGIRDDVHNLACSGAKINDVTKNKFKGEQPQVKRLRELNAAETVDLVTITIGGNDLGFSSIIAECFTKPIACDQGRLLDTGADVGQKLDGIAQEGKRIQTEVIPALRSAAPNATIALVGYPRILPTSGYGMTGCGQITNSERNAINRYVDTINWNWKMQAASSGIYFLDVTDAFNLSELCTTPSDMIGLAEYGYAKHEWLHPNESGQAALSDAVYAELHTLGVVAN